MPERVKEQILEIRTTGETNMFDLPVVQRMAYERDYFELVIFLEEHPKEYAHFILTGGYLCISKAEMSCYYLRSE